MYIVHFKDDLDSRIGKRNMLQIEGGAAAPTLHDLPVYTDIYIYI